MFNEGVHLLTGIFFFIMAISLPTCSVLLLFSISYTVWISFDLFTAFENHFHLRLLQRNSVPKWQMKCKRLMWIHNIVIYRVCIICITDTNIIEAVISKRQYSFINSPIWIFIPFSTDLKILMLLAILWTMAINLYVCVLALLWNSLKCAPACPCFDHDDPCLVQSSGKEMREKTSAKQHQQQKKCRES